jgi:uncharacterized membrane protein YfcA
VTPAEYAALFAVGFIAAVINVFAAGGSFLTLPMLLFLGLPAGLANGTNRVGVLAQNIGAVVGFHRHGRLPWRWAISAGIPATIGAAAGVWMALTVPDVAFRRVLSLVMLATALATVLRRSMHEHTREAPRAPWHPAIAGGFLLMGIYGGFLQAGVGFFSLALTTLAGFDLVRGNAIKVLVVLLLTMMSLIVFANTGNVDWPAGLALAAGNVLGAAIGVKIAVVQGHKWLEHVVTATIVAFAVLLWIT